MCCCCSRHLRALAIWCHLISGILKFLSDNCLLWKGCPRPCRKFSSFPDLSSLVANGIPSQSWLPKMSPDVAKSPLVLESHSLNPKQGDFISFKHNGAWSHFCTSNTSKFPSRSVTFFRIPGWKAMPNAIFISLIFSQTLVQSFLLCKVFLVNF